MSIFIGLGPVTHKIRFFLKFVYVQLAHMLGQIHTLDVYRIFHNFCIKIYIQVTYVFIRAFTVVKYNMYNI